VTRTDRFPGYDPIDVATEVRATNGKRPKRAVFSSMDQCRFDDRKTDRNVRGNADGGRTGSRTGATQHFNQRADYRNGNANG
jgi:hypothetical protein